MPRSYWLPYAAAVGIAVATPAVSQPAHDRAAVEKAHNSAPDDGYGATNPLLPSIVLAPVKIQSEPFQPAAEQQTSEHSDNGIKWTDRAIVGLTLVLALCGIAGGFIAFFQWKALRDQVKKLGEAIQAEIDSGNARATENAAALAAAHAGNEIAARAAATAIKLERPHLFVESPRLEESTDFQINPRPNMVLLGRNGIFRTNYDIFNYGRSAAIIAERSASIFVVRGGELPERPDVNPNDTFTDFVVIPSSGSRKGWEAFYRGKLDDALIDELRAARAAYIDEEEFKTRTKLYLFVRLKYDGVYDTHDEIGVLWQFLLPRGWIPRDVPNYSYRKLSG